jgi:hypothetical protein
MMLEPVRRFKKAQARVKEATAVAAKQTGSTSSDCKHCCSIPTRQRHQHDGTLFSLRMVY